ncbi:MAG: hypothetical protein KC416_09100 [Myxococcales bacterium]|nr:hypothetical protein [Myxococcales bacterium]
MDADQHRRFLNYLELRIYFPKRGAALNAETFALLDAELAGLLERERVGTIEAHDSPRIVELRRLLLRD